MLRAFALLIGTAASLVALGPLVGPPTVPLLAPLAGTVPAAVPAAPAGPLPFYYDLYTFRGEGGRTDVVASVAVPARGLESERVDGTVRYRFDIRFVVSDTLRRTVARTDDSVFVAGPGSLDQSHLLHTHVQVEAPPSRTTIQRVIMTDATRPGVGQLYSSFFPVPDYRGDALMLSDIALGLPGAVRGWTRRGVTLALLPTSQFPESAFDVYYEIYDPTPGARYETELAVEPLGGGEDPGAPVRLRFEGDVPRTHDGIVGELRRVATALPEGAYRLRVTVTEPETGRSATTARTFAVRPWEAGATMVAALPRRR